MADPGKVSESASLASLLQGLFRTCLKPGTDEEYSSDELARATGLSVTYVNYLRSGERDNPTLAVIQQLANFFRVQPNYFFDQVDPDAADVDPDLTRIAVLARRMPAGPPRAGLRAIVEQVAALDEQRKAERRGQPDAKS
ncbi:helix-turn-helix domain-containing protein [Micromonospora chokoriensis]